jgi:hypothetical protein
MPKLNMSNYDSSSVGNFKVVQPGIYLVKIVDVVVKHSTKGFEYWNLKLEIAEDGSEYYGQKLFDNIIFTEKALNRAKLIFESCGVDVSIEREYTPDDLLGAICKVEIDRIEPYIVEGKERHKSVIAYAGYYSADSAAVSKVKESEEEIPF